MNFEKIRKYTYTVVLIIGTALLSYLFLKHVFIYLLPFFAGWFIAFAVRPIATLISKRVRIRERYLRLILTVVILSIGGRMRMTRTNMLEVLNSDYIRTARAKGLKEGKVIYKHAFRNTMIPLVTSLAGLIPSLFSGAMITEQVFNLTGIGNYALTAMTQGDIPVIMTYNMFLAILSVIGVLLADLMYAVVDPRGKLA